MSWVTASAWFVSNHMVCRPRSGKEIGLFWVQDGINDTQKETGVTGFFCVSKGNLRVRPNPRKPALRGSSVYQKKS